MNESPRELTARASRLAQEERWIEAEASYRQLTALQPDSAVARHNWGVSLQALDRHEDAVAAFEQAIARQPDYAAAFLALSISYERMGALDAALVGIECARGIAPSEGRYLLQHARVLNASGRVGEALDLIDDITAGSSAYAESRSLLGLIFKNAGRPDLALEAFDAAIAADPALVAARHNRANLHLQARRFSLAVADFDAVLARAPGTSWERGLRLYAAMHVYDWRDFDAQRRRILDELARGLPSAQPLIVQHLTDDPACQQAAARLWARVTLPPPAPRLPWIGVPTDRKIRVAYVSRDFRSHAVSFLMAGVLAHHDRDRFEIAAINYGEAVDDPMQQRLRASVEAFLDVGHLSDAEIRRACRDLSIDIAVDLTGYTDGARSALFAKRLAPVQMLFLGYLGTSGSAHYDLVLADPVLVPEEARPFHDERILSLPWYQPNDAERPHPAPLSREAAGLPSGAFVFCCFNNAAKITPGMFAVWARILRECPDAVLWLLGEGEEAAAHLRAHASGLGLAPERLVFADRCDRETYLARLAAADLFLDTLPYNAGTTASDALWMGLPVLTLLGRSFAGRVGASVVTAAGMPEFIADSEERYIALAIGFARDPASLRAHRDALTARRAALPLFDPAQFTPHLEQAFLTALMTGTP
jgi:predicted O-linked N-acetylglucosamine transferase (SPINDLY family)